MRLAGESTEPDPAVGSSGVSGEQARFEGSDRQARGRLMKALSAGPVDVRDVAGIMQRSDEAAARLLVDLGPTACVNQTLRFACD